MDNRVTDQAAFILRRRDWRNTSLILDLFTRDHGCIRALARGARRNPAKSPHQPFMFLNISWSGSQELKTLTAIEGQSLPVSEQNYLALLYVNELIAALLPQGEPNPDIFDGYLALLKGAVGNVDASDIRTFECELMRQLGYFPDITVDAESGEAIRTGKRYQFLINSGFVACPESAADSVDGRVVMDWSDGNYQNQAVLELAKSVLGATIDFNLHGKKLKSRDVYREMKRRK